MATDARDTPYDSRLFEWYTKYVSEPESKLDVYGYTLLVIGYLLAIGGMLIYQIGPTGTGTPQSTLFLVREVAAVPSAIGLVLSLLGIVLLLPVTRRSLVLAVIGAIGGIAAVFLFVLYYPGNWFSGTPSYSSLIIALYTAGIAVVAGVVVMVPVITGERSYFAETAAEGTEYDHPAIMIGDADRGGLFAVFKRGREWTWRFIDQEAVAGATGAFLSRLETEDRVEAVKRQVADAGLLEITNAAFRLYESATGEWQWYLMREDGSAVAEGAESYVSRDDADADVNAIKDHGPDAAQIVVDSPIYETIREPDGWRWRLVDRDRTPMALGPGTHNDRAGASAALDQVRNLAGAASVIEVDDYGVEIRAHNDGWTWWLRDDTHTRLADATARFESKGVAEEAVYDVLEQLNGASVIEAGQPTFDVYQRGDSWRFRLVDETGGPVAAGTETRRSIESARDDAMTVRDGVAGAETVRVEDLTFETYRADGGWHWRLVTADRAVRAESTETYESESEASAVVERVRSEAPNADLIEFENAAFQVYEAPEGAWRWRLIDEDGTVLADSGHGEYDSREGAMAAMTTLRENAPDAEHLEIENAAFELFEDDRGWGYRLVDDIGETIADGTTRHEMEAGARNAMDELVNAVSDVPERQMADPVFEIFADEDDAWWWRFVLPDGRILATSTESFGTRHEAESAVEDVAAIGDGAPVATLGRLAVRLEPADWTWDFVDADRDVVATGLVAHEGRKQAEAAIEGLMRDASEATVYEIRTAAFDCYQDDEGWRWRLIDEDHDVWAESPGPHPAARAAHDAAERVAAAAPDAEFVDYEDAAFELYETDEGWTWRLLDETGATLATAAVTHEHRQATETEVEAVRDEIDDASVIEIDTAAFEFHRTDAGWRWRLVDEHGNELGESVAAFDTRAAAQAELETVKELAPDAWVSIAE